jgi:hypothetical protein
MKKHIKFKFIHWEPQEEKPTPYGGLLSDDDFEFRPSEEEKEFNRFYFEFKNQIGSVRKEIGRASCRERV